MTATQQWTVHADRGDMIVDDLPDDPRRRVQTVQARGFFIDADGLRIQADGRESEARPVEMRRVRRLREDVPAEIPEAFRWQTRLRSSALHPVFLLPGTLPERRDRTADDADDAVREGGRPSVPRGPGGKKQIKQE